MRQIYQRAGLIIACIFILSLLFPLSAFSQQEGEETSSCAPGGCSPPESPPPPSLEEEIVPLKNLVKDIYLKRDYRIILYRAVKEDNISLCDEIEDLDVNEACKLGARYTLFAKIFIKKGIVVRLMTRNLEVSV